MSIFEHGNERLSGIREHLPGRGHGGFVYFFCAALAFKVKTGDGIYFVAPKLNADRALGLGREKVEDPAPDGELAGAVHLVPALIARPGKALSQLLYVGAVAPAQPDGVIFICARRDSVLEGCLRGGDHNAAAPVDYAPEHGKALLLIFGGGAFGAPELEILCGVKGHVFRPGKLSKVLRQLCGGGFVRRYEHGLFFRPLPESVCEHGPLGPGETRGINGHRKTPPKR